MKNLETLKNQIAELIYNSKYDEDSRAAEKTYKNVCEEYQAMADMFTEEELEVLSEIN